MTEQKSPDDHSPDLASIPTSMRSARRWLVWRSETNKDPTKKPIKVPYYIDRTKRRGALDSAADQSKFATFADAVARLNNGSYSGLGFALGPDGTGNHWQGIDFDDIPNRPALESLADDLPGYVEESPSGKGLHAIGYGRPYETLGSNATGIEAYSAGRFFTVTGNNGQGDVKCIADFVNQILQPMHRAKSNTSHVESKAEQYQSVSNETVVDLRSALMSMSADDRDLWQRMGHALKTLGEAGRGLFVTWSATSEKFDPIADAKTWDSFKPNRTSYQAVFAEAQRQGWVNPRRANSHHPFNSLSTFSFISAGMLLAKPTPATWLIRGMIEDGDLCTVFGASKVGKSFVTIDWACCIATGICWHGRETKPGSVFYIAGEGHKGISRRLKAWAIHNNKNLDKAPIFISERPAALMDASNAASVADGVRGLAKEHGNPSLIVIDTLARNFGVGQENDNSDIGVFIHNVDTELRLRYGAAVVIVHHSGHGEVDRARGASALHAAMDCEFRMEHKDKTRSLVCTKSKESEVPAPMHFMLEQIELPGWIDAYGETVTSAVLVSSMAPGTRARSLNGANRIAYEALTHALSTTGEPTPEVVTKAKSMFAPAIVVSEEVWRKRAYAEGISDGGQGAMKKAFSRARKALLDLKLICTWDGFYWLDLFASYPTPIVATQTETGDIAGHNGTFVSLSSTPHGTDRDTPLRGVPCPGAWNHVLPPACKEGDRRG